MLLERVEDMKSIAAQLQQELEEVKKRKLEGETTSFVYRFIEDRFKGYPLRAFFTRQVLAIAQDTTPMYYKLNPVYSAKVKLYNEKLPFIVETVITIQYLHNQILDKKSNITDSESINTTLLASNILKDTLYDYIDEHFSSKNGILIRKYIRKIFTSVDFGQRIEKQFNTFSNFSMGVEMKSPSIPKAFQQSVQLEAVKNIIESAKKDVPLSWQSYVDLYFQRIYLTTASLFVEISKLICEAFHCTSKTSKMLIDFSTSYGLMRQIINDNADWIPQKHQLSSTGKIASDAFSDLKNGNITLPLLLHLSQTKKGHIAQLLKNTPRNWNPKLESDLLDEIMDSNSIFKSVHYSRQLAAISLQTLSINTKAALLLKDSCEIAYWNRFLKPVLKTKAYRAFKDTAWYQNNLPKETALQKDIALNWGDVRWDWRLTPSLKMRF